ncbi:MAG: BrnA antitoxin family protein [Azoarcus sp.]|jgi:uncharacterized protein (DUF4415 family)|nr:BrnA antitoxin family protein [Azoarcus sp.]
MSKKITSKISVDLDEAPPWDEKDFEKARMRVGMKDVSREEFREAVRDRLGKQRVSIMLDKLVIEFFKAKAGGRGYQTLINTALVEAMQGRQIADVIRETIREEMRLA